MLKTSDKVCISFRKFPLKNEHFAPKTDIIQRAIYFFFPSIVNNNSLKKYLHRFTRVYEKVS